MASNENSRVEEGPQFFEVDSSRFSLMDRFDPVFFNPKYEAIDLALQKSKYEIKSLWEIATLIKDGPHQTPEFVQSGVPFLQKGDVIEGEINLERPKKISMEFHNKNPKTQAHPGDILIRKIGVGPREAAVVPPKSPPLHIFVTLALIRLKNNYNPDYVEIFLNSKFGRSQTERLNKGIGSPCLHLEDLREVKIILPPERVQNEIILTVHKSRTNKRNMQKQISNLNTQTIDYLHKELELPHLSFKVPLCFTSNVDDRLDPYYYLPDFEKVKEILLSGKYAVKMLEDVGTMVEETINLDDNPDAKIKYVQIQDIDSKTNAILTHTELLASDAPGRAKLMLRKGDIIIPKLGGSLNSIGFVDEESDGHIASNGFTILRVPDSKMRLYVLYYLNTSYYKLQVMRNLTGTIMPSISTSDLKKILIPIPNDSSTKSLADKFSHYRSEVFKLENEISNSIEHSKKIVERLISGG